MLRKGCRTDQSDQPGSLGPVDVRIGELASRQRGFVTRAQLIALGLSPAALKYRVEKGHMIAAYRGVYAVGHIPIAAVDRAAGALLACGPGSVLSHSSALSLWGLVSTWKLPFDVTTAGKHERKNVCVHRSSALGPIDVRTHLGLRVTSPARTLLDNAPLLPERQLTRAVNDARLSGILHLAALQDVVARFPRHPGAKALRPLASTTDPPTRSSFEDDFMAFVERYNLPRPKLNTRFHGREVDALFEAEQLIVELDGYGTHFSRDAFEDDRERDANGLTVGVETVRITRERLIHRPETEARRLHAILAYRRRVLAALAANEADSRSSYASLKLTREHPGPGLEDPASARPGERSWT